MAFDVVIPLGKGSFIDNFELRYCLRSIEANLKGYREIVLIGDIPDWCVNVIKVPMPDPYKRNKAANIISKIMMGCVQPCISDVFVRMSDDQYFLRPIEAWKLATIYNWEMGEKKDWKDTGWNRLLRRTVRYLKKRVHGPIYNYESHVPMLVHKNLFLKTMIQTDFGAPPGYVTNSIYYNTINEVGRQVNQSERAVFMDEGRPVNITNETFLCHNDAGLSYELINYLKAKFPHASKYEKKEATKAEYSSKY